MYYTLGPVLCFILIVVNVKAVKGAKIKKVSVDVGKNITIQCPQQKSKDVMWVRESRENITMKVLANGSLFLQEVDRNDSAVYYCTRENDVKDIRGIVNVTVRTPPPPLNVTIKPSTILVLILWEVKGTGGYPIVNFTAQYRLAYTNDSWLPISPNHITPNCRQIEVYNLKPNTTYEFRMWATNLLGRSPIVYQLGKTKKRYEEEETRNRVLSLAVDSSIPHTTELPQVCSLVPLPAWSLFYLSFFLVFSLNFLFFFTKELARHLLEGADKFDTRWWAAAVGVVMGSLVLLGIGTCVLLYQECQIPTVEEEQEVIELVPNIILNPGFEGTNYNNDQPPDENSNHQTPMRLNNNTVVQPRNM